MSFMYPRLIELRRPRTPVTPGGTPVLGLVPYQGLASTESSSTPLGGEDVLFTRIPCNIQIRTIYVSRGQRMLPSNATNQETWRIFIPKKSLQKGVLRDHDIAVDEDGYRYDTTPYWNSMGYRLECVRLEA